MKCYLQDDDDDDDDGAAAADDDIFSRFDRTPIFDGRTDGGTERGHSVLR